MNEMIESSFQAFLKDRFNTGRKLNEMDARIMRHFYFGGFDAALDMSEEAMALPLPMAAVRFQSWKLERANYNQELRRMKAKRKPQA